jgi:hypothetical protein
VTPLLSCHTIRPSGDGCLRDGRLKFMVIRDKECEAE